jgi:hypothetical protein
MIRIGFTSLLAFGCLAAANAQIFNPATQSYYELLDLGSFVGWEDANAAAQAKTFMGRQGHLATLTSEEENDFVQTNFLANLSGDTWIGGFQDQTDPDETDPSAGWMWVTGEAWGYTNWSFGEPNDSGLEKHLEIYSDGRWNDEGNGINRYAMVEYLVPEPATFAVIGVGVLSLLRRRKAK